MIVYNSTRNTFIANDLKVAKNMWERLRGLIGSKELKEGEGFLLPSCQGIHTFFMSYSIDVLYLDQDHKVIHMLKNYRPNLTGPVIWKAKSILELPRRAIGRSRTKVGDILFFEKTPSDDSIEVIPIERSLPKQSVFAI